MLYLATHGEQPLRRSPHLSVEAVNDATIEVVRQWFSLPVVRFVGAYTGCSCGFQHIVAEEPVDYWEGMFDLGDYKADEDEDTSRSMQSLVALIREHIVGGAEVQMYPVWNGEENLPPKGTIEISADALDPRTFFFNERFFYRVRLS